VNALALKESLSGMLRRPGLSHELPKWKTPRSEDQPSFGGPSLGRLVRVILDRSSVFENTDIFTFLGFSLNLFPDKDKGFHCLNGASHQESARIGIARLSAPTTLKCFECGSPAKRLPDLFYLFKAFVHSSAQKPVTRFLPTCVAVNSL
jgi:hypothetical protein